MKLSVLLCAGAALVPSLAIAQELDRTTVDSVIVAGSPLSAAEAGDTAHGVEYITADDLDRTGSPSLLRTLGEMSGQVQVNSAQANPFQPNLSYRGFEASPLVGNAQGLAVYIDGVRFNQAFGDTVNWDLIPDGAIRSVTVEGSNPVYGLNALGGSIDLRFKTGADVDGFEAEVSGGSFGRVDGFAEYGYDSAGLSFYAAGRALDEDGWRDFSPSSLRQFYSGLTLKGDRHTTHFRLLAADNDLTGNGTSPIEFLAVDRSAVFTHPDNTKNELQRFSVNTDSALSDSLSFQGVAYVQSFQQASANGDAADLETCEAPLDAYICLEDQDDEPLEDADGNLILDTLGGEGYAFLNRGATDTDNYGLALQLRREGRLLSGDTVLVAGLTFDGGSSTFGASTELGVMSEDRGYEGPGVIVESDEVGSIGVATHNRYYGAYIGTTTELSPKFTLSLSGRYNAADVTLRDLDPGGPLTGSHSFSRFNPSVGLTWKPRDGLSLYGGYSEANRAPTPAELSCADPAAPCSLTNFFVGDPPLEQVVSRTFEAGVRGASGAWRWAFTGYSTKNDDDIMFIASPIVGRAYFQNVGKTKREGLEADLGWTAGRYSLGASWAWSDATFQSPLVLNAPENPEADADGRILVRPGDMMPGVAQHKVKLLADVEVTDRLTIGASAIHQSGQFLAGDENNQNPKTNPFTVVNVAARYALNERVEIFGSIENLFDTEYETFGTFSPVDEVELDELPGGIATDPRAFSPGAPVAGYVGLRVKF